MIILFIITLSGCASVFAPPSGTHYTLKYGEVEVNVDDWTDREGVEFEYTNGETKVILRKKSVDTATPAAALNVIQAENQSKILDLVEKVANK